LSDFRQRRISLWLKDIERLRLEIREWNFFISNYAKKQPFGAAQGLAKKGPGTRISGRLGVQRGLLSPLVRRSKPFCCVPFGQKSDGICDVCRPVPADIAGLAGDIRGHFLGARRLNADGEPNDPALAARMTRADIFLIRGQADDAQEVLVVVGKSTGRKVLN
jgi:hypothetical protein